MKTLRGIKYASHKRTNTARSHLYEGPKKVKLRDGKWNGGSQGLGEWDKQLLFNGDRISVWEDEKVLETDGDGCTTM